MILGRMPKMWGNRHSFINFINQILILIMYTCTVYWHVHVYVRKKIVLTNISKISIPIHVQCIWKTAYKNNVYHIGSFN